MSLDEHRRRIVQMRVALRRLVGAPSPLRKRQLFDNPPKTYPQWQADALNLLEKRGVVTALGENWSRTYRLKSGADRRQLRDDLEDDVWISELLWPAGEPPPPLVEDATPAPPPPLSPAPVSSAPGARPSPEEVMEMVMRLMGYMVEKVGTIDERLDEIKSRLDQLSEAWT